MESKDDLKTEFNKMLEEFLPNFPKASALLGEEMLGDLAEHWFWKGAKCAYKHALEARMEELESQMAVFRPSGPLPADAGAAKKKGAKNADTATKPN